MKPIVGNKAVEILDKPVFKAASLSFTPLSFEEISKLPLNELEAHMTLVCVTLVISGYRRC